MFVRSSSPQRPQRPERTPAAPAPPLPEGCGWLSLARRRSWEELGTRFTRGDPGSGRPSQCVPKTNHDFHRGSFSPIPSSTRYLPCKTTGQTRRWYPPPRSLNFYFIATLWLWPQPTIPSQPTVSCTTTRSPINSKPRQQRITKNNCGKPNDPATITATDDDKRR